MMFHDEITVVRPQETYDRYGNTVYDWTNPQRTTWDRVSVQPVSQTETGTDDARHTVVTGWRIFSAAGVDIDVRPIDRIEWAGKTLEVVGEVARWPHPIRRGAVHHVEFDVERYTG